jgi:hypothetical protein
MPARCRASADLRCSTRQEAAREETPCQGSAFAEEAGESRRREEKGGQEGHKEAGQKGCEAERQKERQESGEEKIRKEKEVRRQSLRCEATKQPYM